MFTETASCYPLQSYSMGQSQGLDAASTPQRKMQSLGLSIHISGVEREVNLHPTALAPLSNFRAPSRKTKSNGTV